MNEDLKKDYISKSKIKEKIEEYTIKNSVTPNPIVLVLQELLEEDKEK